MVYGYDQTYGNVITVIDPNGHRVQYWYNGLGRLDRVDEFEGDGETVPWAVYAETTYSYGDGNRVLQMEADGSQTAFVGAHYEVWLPGPPPPAPSNLWAVYHEQVFIAFVTLGWQPTTAEGGSTFSVYRSATTPVPIDAGHRIASGLTSGSHTDYGGRLGDYYVVTAVNPYGESDPSNTAQAVKVGIDGREEDLDRQVIAGGGEVLSGEEVITKYYFLGGQRVAMRQDGDVYYFHTDHLGSTSAMSDGQGAAHGDPVRYLPFGEVRSGDLGELPTDHGFTGHKHEADHLGLIFMQARYYVAELGRFVSPDILIPDPADPQSYNRYAYVRNNPVRYRDPSGHDPLDANWRDEFRSAHGRDPEWQDRLIRLFSIAFPEEWDWSAFYMSDGTYIEASLEKVLRDERSSGRNWASMPDILERLAGWYTKKETDAFVRDVGTLFGGLPDRFSEPSRNKAVTGCNTGLLCDSPSRLPAHVWAYMGPEGLPQHLTGTSDEDANVHHWAWGLVLGYHFGGPLAVAANTYREFQQADGNPYLNLNSRADIWLGNRAAMMGWDIYYFGASPRIIRLLWTINVN